MKIASNSTWPWLTARNTRGVVVALCRWQRADGRSPMPQGSFSLSVSLTGDSVVSLSLSLSLSYARQVYTVDEVQTRPCTAASFSPFHLDRFVRCFSSTGCFTRAAFEDKGILPAPLFPAPRTTRQYLVCLHSILGRR